MADRLPDFLRLHYILSSRKLFYNRWAMQVCRIGFKQLGTYMLPLGWTKLIKCNTVFMSDCILNDNMKYQW